MPKEPIAYKIRAHDDNGWYVYFRYYGSTEWLGSGWGPHQTREDAEKALTDHLNRQSESSRKEAAYEAEASFYNSMGHRTHFAGAGAVGAVAQPEEWR